MSFILGTRIPEVPYVVADWRKTHPGKDIEDGQIFTRPWPGGTDKRRDQVIYYQYKADRARRTLRGIDGQIAKAEKAVPGRTAVKPNGSCSCPVARRASTGRWEPRPGRWPGSRDT